MTATETPGRVVGGPGDAVAEGRPGPARAIRVIGLDLSLTSTGIGCNAGWTERIRLNADPSPGGFQRMRAIRARVFEFAGTATDLVVVEGLAVGSTTGQHLTRAGLWHLVVEALDARGTPWVAVSPASLKRYATGKGNAAKDEVLAAVVRRFPDVEVRGNDEADALVLAAMGADWLGRPMVAMPAANREALAKVAWPVIPDA